MIGFFVCINFKLTLVMFRTEITPSPSKQKISLKDGVICLGSCFAENIGLRLVENKFTALVNPGGIVYNPLSIVKLVNLALSDGLPTDNSYVQQEGVFYNYDFHSRIAALSKDELEEKIRNLMSELRDSLQKAKWIILTLGTSLIYKKKEDEQIVANCHKVPSANFVREMLTQKQILHSFSKTYEQLILINPTVNILLTVSPVRHLKETLELNSVSKSILRIACDTLSREFDNVHYFPAYEIMMDDLRDYRYYDRDLLHPSDVALDYIWEKFSLTYIDKDTRDFLKTWDQIKKDIQHRPFNAGTEAHKSFLQKLMQKLKEISNQVNVENEIRNIEERMNG